MKRLVLAAAGAAVIGLTSCTHAADPGASASGHGTGRAITPISCSEQYRTWSHGQGKGLIRALDAVTSAATTSHVRKAALRQTRQAVARATRHPMPACADPRGYWSVLLMHVNAAVGGRASASSVRAAMRNVPDIHHKLLAEVIQTVHQ